MSLEQAVIALFVSGVPEFEATNEKIKADLTSTERAGKAAEGAAASADKAAKEAERSSRELQGQITKTIGRLSALAGFAERASTALGVDPNSPTGRGLDVTKDVLGGAAQGAQLGAAVGSFVPVVGTGVGAGIGAVIGGMVGLAEGNAKIQKKLDQLAQHPYGRSPIEDALVREQAAARLEWSSGGGGRQVQ